MTAAHTKALEELVADCELVNRRSLEKNGVGLIDKTIIARARAALREPVAEAPLTEEQIEAGFADLGERFDFTAGVRFAERMHNIHQPIDMVLHCPACGLQHIDAPGDGYDIANPTWTNPPHRSHLCHGCGHIWRPADVCTNGVAAVKTKGKDDSPIKAKT